MIKKLRIILFVVVIINVLAWTGIVVMQNRQESVKETQYLQKKNQEIREIERELQKTQDSLNEVQAQYDEMCEMPGSVVVCIKDPAESIYTGVFNTFKQSGYTGTLVFSEGKKPGDENLISVEHFTEMINDGWSCAVSSKSSNWKEELEQERQVISEATDITPSTCYLEDGIYEISDESMDKTIKSLGFRTVLYSFEETDISTVRLLKEEQNELVKIQLLPYRLEDVSNAVGSVAENSGYTGVITISTWTQDNKPDKEISYSDYGISEFLWPLEDNINQKKLRIVSTEQLWQGLDEHKEKVQKAESEYRESIQDYTDTIKALNEKKKELMAS